MINKYFNLLALAATVITLTSGCEVVKNRQVKERTDGYQPGIVLTPQGYDTWGRRWGTAPVATTVIAKAEPKKPEPAPAPPVKTVTLPTPATASADSSGGVVRISKEAPALVAIDEEYTTTITLYAVDAASSIEVADVIPSGATYVSSSPPATQDGNNLAWKFPAMAKGETKTIKVKLKAAKEGSYKSCATVHALPQACVVTVIGKPGLKIVKTGPTTAVIRENISYTIQVSNPGNMAARGVVVTDNIPAGLSHSSGKKTLTWNIGDLAPKESRTIPVVLQGVSMGKHCNKAVATSSNAGKAEAEACTTILVPGLVVTKTGPKLQFLGKLATYSIGVTNSGDTTLNNVVVTDRAPAATTIQSARGATVTGNIAVWQVASLKPKEGKSFNVVLTTMIPGTHPNNVSATTAEGLTGSAVAPTKWEGISALLITMGDDPDPIKVGGSTTYTIKVTNQGTADDAAVKLMATFDEEITPTGASNGGVVSGKTVTFPAYPTLAPKQSFTYTITAKGVKAGDHRLKVTRTSRDIPKPTTVEESTRVY